MDLTCPPSKAEREEKQDGEKQREKNKVLGWIRPEQCESEVAVGFGKSSSVFSSSILAGCISIKERKRCLQGVSGVWWLVIHQFTIGHKGGGDCSYFWLGRLWLMEPAFVSGVEQFVNKVMHSVVIHGHNVTIKDYSLTVIGWLSSTKMAS